MIFNSQKEIYQALLDGKTIYHPDLRMNVCLDEVSGKLVAITDKGDILPASFTFTNYTVWRLPDENISISVENFRVVFLRVYGANINSPQGNARFDLVMKELRELGAVK